jgi:hypothetical protein
MAQLHSTLLANHRPYADVYANSAARLAATGFTRSLGGSIFPFDSSDLYKKVLQLDDATEWILTAITPTWVQISGAGALANDSVTNAQLANMAQSTIKGRAAGAGTGDPTDLTATQATAILNNVVGDSGAGGTKGLVPAPAAGDAAAGKFLKADATWEAPGGGGVIAPLVIEDANTVAQRNATNAQTFNLYRTFTDAANYERVRLAPDGSGNFLVIAEAAGTGSQRQLHLGYGATRRLAYDGTQFYPDANNVTALGTGSNRFSAVRAVNIWAQTALLMEGTGGSSKILDAGATNGGVVKFASETTGGDGTWSGGVNAPSSIGANQNNYDPTGIAYFQRWSASTPVDITGMTRFQVQGQSHRIVNVGSNAITLKHENASSTAANRFLCSTGADVVLSADQGADLTYDATTQRWRVFKLS